MENIKLNRTAVRVYPFEVLDKIKEGETVNCIDKIRGVIKIANNLEMQDFVEIINHDNSDNRYDFYYIKETDEEEKDGLDL